MTDANTFPHPILITGGAGFLGSHMVALCLEKQVDVVVIDNLSNSDLSNLQKLETHFKASIPFYNIDYENNQRVFYYVERNIERLLYEPSINQLHSFKLLKFNNSLDLDLDKAHKSFPEKKPQFILIKHD